MKKYKMSEKREEGFSLVELVVVVLIMAIIAVALAPQVVKWVKNSKNATDVQTKNELLRLASIALTDKEAFSVVCNGGYTITASKSVGSGETTFTYTEGGGPVTVPDPTNLYWKHFLEVCALSTFDEFESIVDIKSEPDNGAGAVTIKIEVYEDGHTNGYITGIENDDLDIS